MAGRGNWNAKFAGEYIQIFMRSLRKQRREDRAALAARFNARSVPAQVFKQVQFAAERRRGFPNDR